MEKFLFRAWDNVENKMYYCGEEEDIVFILGCEGIRAERIKGYKYDDPVEALDHLIYMQYTGLKDKNDKELWVSDIIENEHGERWLIVWEGTGFRVALGGNKEAIYAPNEYWFNSCKKIGNIYENPELLEG